MAFLLLLCVALSQKVESPLFYTVLSQMPAFLYSVFYLMRIILKEWDFNSASFFYSLKAISPYLLSLSTALSMGLNICSMSQTATLLTLAIAKLSCEHLFSLSSASIILRIEHPSMVVISAIPSLAAIIITFAFTHDSVLHWQFWLVALGTLVKHWSLAYHRKSQILHGYNRNRLEWMATRLKCLADQEEEVDSGGYFKAAHIKVDSWLFKRAVLVREEARLLAQIEDAVKEGLQREGLTIKIQREDRLRFLQDIQKTHAQSKANRMQIASRQVDLKRSGVKLDWERIGKLLSENTNFNFSNESVSKLLTWEMQVIQHKVMSIDNKPDYFNDDEDMDLDEVDLKRARKALSKAQYSDRLTRKDLLNQLDWGTCADPPEGQEKDITNKPHEKIVKEMLNSYSSSIGQFQHIVASCDVDGDEYDRMKIDLILDGAAPIYHRKWVGIGRSDHRRMHALINLLRLPILLLFSVMTQENYGFSFEGFTMQSLIPLLLIPVIAGTLGLMDFDIQALFAKERDLEALQLIDAMPAFIFPLISLLFSDEELIDVSHITSLLLAGSSTIICMVFYRQNHTSSCSQSTIELVKCSLKHDSLNGLQDTDTKLNLILKSLGPAALNRIAFDTLLSQNKAQLNYTAPPSIQGRELFDVYFKSRSAAWGNLRPRPSVEALEKSWILKDIDSLKCGEQKNDALSGIKVFMDPDLDYSTFACALQRYEILRAWNFDDHELVMNERRKQMILEKFADIMDVSFVNSLGKGDDSVKSNQQRRLSFVSGGGDLSPAMSDTTKFDPMDTSESKGLLSLKLYRTDSYEENTQQTTDSALDTPLANVGLSGDEDQSNQVVNNRKRLIIKEQPLNADFIRQKILAKIKNPQYYTMFMADKESKVSEGSGSLVEASSIGKNSLTGHITELDEKFQLRKQIQEE